MNIGKHIESLLKRHPSVFVKGLGVFKRIHQSAKYDSTRNVYLPPVTFIEFEHFESDGFDFVNYIQELDQLSREDADAKVEDVVSTILDLVYQNGEVSIDGLGTFESFGNAYIFKPLDLVGFTYEEVESNFVESHSSANNSEEEPADILPESNGFVEEHVEAERIIEEVEIESIEEVADTTLVDSTGSIEVLEEVIVDEPVDSSSLEAGLESKVSESLNATNKNVFVFEHRPLDPGDDEHTSDGKSYVYGLLAALSVLLLGGIYYYYTTYYRGAVVNPQVGTKENIDTANLPLDTATVDSTLLIDSVLLNQDTLRKSTKVDTVLKEREIDHKYTIVIGTHKNLESAEIEAAKYNKDGHKSVRVLIPNMEKNRKRVIWGTYATREERDSVLRVVRSRYKADAWGSEI